MKITLVNEHKESTPMLRQINPGAIVMYQNYIYIKLNKRKIGDGIYLNYPGEHSILFNPKYGSIRAVHADTRVFVLKQTQEFEAVVLKDKNDIHHYLR